MAHYLQYFHNTVLGLPPVGAKLTPAMEHELDEMLNTIPFHISEATGSFLNLYFTEYDRESKKVLVTDFASGLIFLSNCLAEYFSESDLANWKKTTKDSKLTGICRQLFCFFDEQLETLRLQFPRDFDATLEMPAISRSLFAPFIKQTIAKLDDSLRNLGIEDRLVEVFLSPYRRFIKGGTNEELTYYRYEYLQKMAVEIPEEEMRLVHSHQATSAFADWLFSQNFNTNLFYDYCVGLWNLQLEELDSCVTRKDVVTSILKSLRGYWQNGRSALDPLMPGTYIRATEWLTAEKNMLSELIADNIKLEAEITAKIMVGSTTSTLGCLIRLAVEVGLLPANNISFLLECAATSFVTVKDEHISYDTLKNGYYKTDPATFGKTKDYLIQMLGLSRDPSKLRKS